MANGTILEYKLIVEKLSNENGLESVLVDGVEAEKVNDTNYYIVVAEDKTEIQVKGTAVSEKAQIDHIFSYITLKTVLSPKNKESR